MTVRCTVIGNPISHAKSPMIQTAFARWRGVRPSTHDMLQKLIAPIK